MSSKRRPTSKTPPQAPAAAEQADQAYDVVVPTEHNPSPEPKPIARQPAFETDRIGDILRRVREHREEELEYISEYLRIRPNYLFALENSRYEDLPADAYVIGFLRTYASYLGLDGKGAIDQYRREMTGRRRKPQLSMPQPMSEGRAPTIAMIIAAAIAALIIYGIWYGLSSPDHSALEKTVTLPEIRAQSPAAETATIQPPSQLTTQTATSDGIALSVPEAAVPATAESAATMEPTAATPASGKTPEVSPKNKEPESVKPAKDQQEKKTALPADPSVKVAAQAQDSDQTQNSATTSKEAGASSFGDAGKARLVIKAERESWVLVTDNKGNTIFDRTLKPGETYNVPSNKGLKLTTGNANGLAFAYDGKRLPKLKGSNPVIRAMSLDGEKMLAHKTEDLQTSTDDTSSNYTNRPMN
ncbi:MAG: DUF4115 domain-containing protein [Alphaproteobacteria bacterium]|nr:DUF4115 domain-containing protein [Alphaproteobacteria bacterium]